MMIISPQEHISIALRMFLMNMDGSLLVTPRNILMAAKPNNPKAIIRLPMVISNTCDITTSLLGVLDDDYRLDFPRLVKEQ